MLLLVVNSGGKGYHLFYQDIYVCVVALTWYIPIHHPIKGISVSGHKHTSWILLEVKAGHAQLDKIKRQVPTTNNRPDLRVCIHLHSK